MYLLVMSARLGMKSCHFCHKPEGFTECIDLFVLVLEGDFGSVTAAFSSSLHRTASLAQMDFTHHILKDVMAISLSSKAPC